MFVHLSKEQKIVIPDDASTPSGSRGGSRSATPPPLASITEPLKSRFQVSKVNEKERERAKTPPPNLSVPKSVSCFTCISPSIILQIWTMRFTCDHEDCILVD